MSYDTFTGEHPESPSNQVSHSDRKPCRNVEESKVCLILENTRLLKWICLAHFFAVYVDTFLCRFQLNDHFKMYSERECSRVKFRFHALIISVKSDKLNSSGRRMKLSLARAFPLLVYIRVESMTSSIVITQRKSAFVLTN